MAHPREFAVDSTQGAMQSKFGIACVFKTQGRRFKAHAACRVHRGGASCHRPFLRDLRLICRSFSAYGPSAAEANRKPRRFGWQHRATSGPSHSSRRSRGGRRIVKREDVRDGANRKPSACRQHARQKSHLYEAGFAQKVENWGCVSVRDEQ